MRQILIEKYIKPSYVTFYKKATIEHWENEFEEDHSTMFHPAIVFYSKKTKLVNETQWFKESELHSYKNHPSVIKYKYGKTWVKMWHKNGRLHRNNDKPAYIVYNKNGAIIEQRWFKDGKQRRDNKYPDRIKYFYTLYNKTHKL
jgi:hypothetical protein